MYKKMDMREAAVVKQIVNRAVVLGFDVEVFDGEETFPKTHDTKIIIDNMMNTDEDVIKIYFTDGKCAGAIQFVYGNSPEEVVCDYTDNELIRKLVEGF